jgi:hypothetical protein
LIRHGLFLRFDTVHPEFVEEIPQTRSERGSRIIPAESRVPGDAATLHGNLLFLDPRTAHIGGRVQQRYLLEKAAMQRHMLRILRKWSDAPHPGRTKVTA